MRTDGQLDMVVAGERWRPVPTLDGCGPDDPCYVVRIADDRSLRIQFGDGVTGRRPPDGGRIEAVYRSGSGDSGNADAGQSENPLATLLDLIADMIDVLERHLEQIQSEAFIETSGGRLSLVDVTDLRAALADGSGELVVRLRVRPRPHRRRRTDRA